MNVDLLNSNANSDSEKVDDRPATLSKSKPRVFVADSPQTKESGSTPTSKAAGFQALSSSSSLLRSSLACLITGILTGLSVSWFNFSVVQIQEHFAVASMLGKKGELMLLVLPCLGGLAVGAMQLLGNLVRTSAAVVPLPTLRVTVNDSGIVRQVCSLMLHVASAAVALGFANSLGPTAPRVQIGARISALVAGLLGAWPAERDVLLAVGAAAGVASGAQAPLAGVVYGLEMVWPSQENRAMYFSFAMIGVVSAIATSASTLTVAGVLADDQNVSRGSSPHRELGLFGVVGILCGMLAWLFNNSLKPTFAKVWTLSQGLGLGKGLHPGFAGLLAGLVAWQFAPEVLFMGWANFRKVLLHTADFTVPELLQLSVVKLVLTAAATTSGMPGGLFAPSMMAGAAAGGALGLAVQGQVEPGVLSDLRLYSTVGMASMHGAVNGVPCTALVLVFELTRDYEFVMPVLCGLGAAYLAASLLDLASASVRRSANDK